MSRPTYKYNEDGSIDWNHIRAEYLENASPEEAAHQLRRMAIPDHAPVTERTLAKVKRVTKDDDDDAEEVERTELPTAGPGAPNAVPPEKVDLCIAYYTVGNRVSWIAEELELSAQTVRSILKKRGIFDPERDRGRR